MKITVVGYGWVGQANALALAIMGYRVGFYDPMEPKRHYADRYEKVYDKVGRMGSVLEDDGEDRCYIVCVGDRVSPEGVQDISLIRSALDSLRGAKGTVVLRSTIIPASLAGLEFDFYVPEFLHEKKAVEECLKPHYFVVGSRRSKNEPEFFAEWEKLAYKSFRGTPEQASYIKYLSNLWNSIRIAFVNEFGSAIAEPERPEDIAEIERVVDFLFEGKFYLRYGKAFGGHCLPKDTRAFIHFQKSVGRQVPFLEGAYKANDLQAAFQEAAGILPEWYSEWRPPEISGKVALKALGKKIVRRLKW